MTGNAPSGMSGDISQLLLGITAGILLAMAGTMLRAPRPVARWTGFAFFLCSALFAIKLWNDQVAMIPPEFSFLIGITAMMSVGWFFLMVLALFGDVDRFRPAMFLAPFSMGLCGLANVMRIQGLMPLLWTISTILQATLAIWAVVIVIRSWKDDLVESRRRLRGPFMEAVAFYILTLNGFDILEMLGTAPDWYPMFNAALFASIVLGGALVFLDPREAMFGAEPAESREPQLAIQPSTLASIATEARPDARPNGASPELDRAAKADLDRLECLMSKDQVWKEEGLTIASLALRAAMPETQLRRLINDCLGYRNFPSYVNAHRIAAAKSRLSDPGEARVSISTIAYDIGFASLGPFNRAFKEESGVSPSEWRRKSLGIVSPISEDA
jgi:AraC-like DNA-binding protein